MRGRAAEAALPHTFQKCLPLRGPNLATGARHSRRRAALGWQGRSSSLCGVITLLARLLLGSLCLGAAVVAQATLRQGPFVGHVDAGRALLWGRLSTPGIYTLAAGAGGTELSCVAEARREHDGCVVWELTGLTPATTYPYRIMAADGSVLCGGDDFWLRTARRPDADGAVRLLFGSCAAEDEGTGETWRRIAQQNVDVVCLLGDTPYIDTTRLVTQRKRYAEFAAFAPMAELLRHTSWYGTWDDHDFASNDTDGRAHGKENSRRAFLEYHANPSYGDGERGIYTSFRRGPVEVFLLDTRWFAATEPSPYLQHHASLLGREQWDWLQKGLAASTAPVKVLACGMVWNGAVRPGKQDHWGSYDYERSALFEFLGNNRIGGVVLVGGDIHRSRVIRHDVAALAGYDILELITSPLHDRIIAAANAPHPGLIKDMGAPNTFLLLEVEQRGGKALAAVARFVNAAGKELFRIDVAGG